MEHVIGFNFSKSEDRFIKIAECFDVKLKGLNKKESKKRLLETIRELKLSLGISYTLGKSGLSSSDIPLLSKNAINDPCIITNPRDANNRDVEVIYESAL